MIDLLRLVTEAYRTPESPPPSIFDFIRMHAMIYEESRRIQGLLAEREAGAAPGAGAGALPELLRGVQRALLEHPVAAQAAFTALIAEGRRFAATPEGADWMAALAGSDLVRQARQVWEAVSLNLLEDDPSTIVPSAYLEALLRAASSADLEGLLRPLHHPPNGGDVGAPG